MSFDIALSGIQAINEQLTSTSNNIANAGTYGFKSTRTNFASMYTGGTANGVKVGSTTQNIAKNGGLLNTGRGTDASINGRGFFAAKTSAGQIEYTRVGIFTKDATDFLVDSSGRKVQGFKLTPPSTTSGAMGDIVVPTTPMMAKATTKLAFAANMSSSWVEPTVAWVAPDPAAAPPVPLADGSYNMSKVSVFHDSLGYEHVLTQYFRLDDATSPPTIQSHMVMDGRDLDPATGATSTMTFSSGGVLTGIAVAGTGLAVAGNTVTMSFAPTNGADPMTVAIDYTGMTLQAGDTTTSKNIPDGFGTGTYVGVELASDGSVIAKYSNGEKQAVARVALAVFPNEEALTPANETSWTSSVGAGTVDYVDPGTGVAGDLAVTTLEGSNVDITAELVSLMTSQRNYQANSKVISTENQMLQSLMQAL